MLISHRHKFIYLKTRKTAGTSVEIYFEPFCIDPADPFEPVHYHKTVVSSWGVVGHRGMGYEGETWFNHQPAVNIRELTGEAVWNTYFKFCAVRNPFDKVVSAFWYQLDDAAREDLRTRDFSEIRKSFQKWASRFEFWTDTEVISIDGRPVVDGVIRYERLSEDMESVCLRLNVPWKPELLGRYKNDFRRNPQHFTEYYDEASRQRVMKAYALDFEHFGYEWPGSFGTGAGHQPMGGSDQHCER